MDISKKTEIQISSNFKPDRLCKGLIHPTKNPDHQKGSLNAPGNDTRRLTNDRTIDPNGHQENRGRWPMFFYNKIRIQISSKLKPKTLFYESIYSIKTDPQYGPQKNAIGGGEGITCHRRGEGGRNWKCLAEEETVAILPNIQTSG